MYDFAYFFLRPALQVVNESAATTTPTEPQSLYLHFSYFYSHLHTDIYTLSCIHIYMDVCMCAE